jgi:c-di-GMP-related signal transduction protein
VAGYELLFCAPGAHVDDAERATSQVIVDAIGDIGLDRLAGARPAYVNVTRELLLAVRPLPLPCDRVVLELLEARRSTPNWWPSLASWPPQASCSRLTTSSISRRWSRCSTWHGS